MHEQLLIDRKSHDFRARIPVSVSIDWTLTSIESVIGCFQTELDQRKCLRKNAFAVAGGNRFMVCRAKSLFQMSAKLPKKFSQYSNPCLFGQSKTVRLRSRTSASVTVSCLFDSSDVNQTRLLIVSAIQETTSSVPQLWCNERAPFQIPLLERRFFLYVSLGANFPFFV